MAGLPGIHAKLIIVDGNHCIAGGYNLWSSTYTDFAPVHDVSIQLSGSIVYCAQNFLNRIWQEITRYATGWDPTKWYWAILSYQRKFYNQVLPHIEPKALAQTVGTTSILALGRMGQGLINDPQIATNAGRILLLEAIKQAKVQIRLSQQMLGGSYIGADDQDFIMALCQAIIAGKKVSIIISDAYAADAYGIPYSGDSVAVTALYLGRIVLGYLNNDRQQAVARLTHQLYVAPLRFFNPVDPQYSAGWQWRSGTRTVEPANHAKVYIIDDQAYYVGSDNIYFSPFSQGLGLQEFGFIVFGKTETKALINSYWDQACHYSEPQAFKDWDLL